MAPFCWNCSPLFGERPRVRRISTSSFLDVASTLHGPSSTATHSKHDSVVPSNRAWHLSQSRVRSLIYWFSTVDSNRVLRMQNLQETMRLSKDIGSDYALFRRVFQQVLLLEFQYYMIWFEAWQCKEAPSRYQYMWFLPDYGSSSKLASTLAPWAPERRYS